jgi:hypothetical protein
MIHSPLIIYNGKIQQLPVGDSIIGVSSEEESVYSKRIDFISETVLYKGEAAVGALEGAGVWRIRKITIANDNDVTETWAGGTANFDKAWADRATLIYS